MSRNVRKWTVGHERPLNITKTRLFKYTKNFITSDIFHISALNIDCGYSLEPPRLGGSNEYPQSMFWAVIRKIMYTPVNPRWGGSNEYSQSMFWAVIRKIMYTPVNPRWGGSNEYSQSMFWAVIRKIMYTPVNPSFTIKKWGLRESKLYRNVFVMTCSLIRDLAYRLPNVRIFSYPKSANQKLHWSDCAHAQLIFVFDGSSLRKHAYSKI